jgi:tyrosine-protein kinase Etk/Wzc
MSNNKELQPVQNASPESGFEPQPTAILVDNNRYIVWALLYRFRFLLFIVSLLVGIGTYVYLHFQPNWYEASINFVPPKRQISSLEGAISSISSTLKDIGLQKLGGKSESYSFNTILFSRTIKDSLIKEFQLAKLYDIPDTNYKQLYAVFDENYDVSLEVEGNYVVSCMHTDRHIASKMANRTLQLANSIAREMDVKEAKTQRVYLEQRIGQLNSAIDRLTDSLALYSKKTLLFSPIDQGSALADAYGEVKSQKMKQEILYDFFKSQYGEDDPRSIAQKEIIGNITSKINSIENNPGFAGNFALKDAAGVAGKYLRMYTEIETFSKVKAFLLPLLEQARLDETRNVPSAYVLDIAIPPSEKSKPRRTLISAGAFAGTFVLLIMIILLRYQYNQFKSRFKPYYTSLMLQSKSK